MPDSRKLESGCSQALPVCLSVMCTSKQEVDYFHEYSTDQPQIE